MWIVGLTPFYSCDIGPYVFNYGCVNH
jgi:hypothetical protein